MSIACEHGHLRRACPHCELDEYYKENDQLRARLDEAVEVLKSIEHVAFECPYCQSTVGYPHKSDCRLAKVLKGENKP